jgi:2-polyprenyl-3-methyl-5-hydroxy-6-metoxy-1,4-benzoquinol methylase
MDEQQISQRLTEYEFYHIIPLTESLSTPGNAALVQSQTPVLQAIHQVDLRRKRVLDIGCRDGLYSFAAERLGAAEVAGKRK